jgi:hypothetical protein
MGKRTKWGCGGHVVELALAIVYHSSTTLLPLPVKTPAFIMSILLSDRQTDDLYVSRLPCPT